MLLHLYFTSGYRGFPPCTLSQHPDSRETGYSNVLGDGDHGDGGHNDGNHNYCIDDHDNGNGEDPTRILQKETSVNG